MLVIDQVIEEGIVPVIVMFIRDEVDWKQEKVTPDVPLEQENPETRLTKDGRVRRMRLPDAQACVKPRVNVQVVIALTLRLRAERLDESKEVAVVSVTVRVVFIYSIRRLLKQVWTTKDTVGFVEEGLMMFASCTVKVVRAAAVEVIHELSWKLMVERTLRVHPLCVAPAILKELRDAPAELEQSLGKDTTTAEPVGKGFVFEKVKVQVELAATVTEEDETLAEASGTGVAVRVTLVASMSVGVDVLQQQVVREKVEVGVVVIGLMMLLSVIVKADPPVTAAELMLIRKVVEFSRVQVDDTEQVQELVPVVVICEGRIRMILEFVIRVLTDVKEKVRLVVTPIDRLKADTLAVVMPEGVKVQDKVVVSIGQQIVPTRFIVWRVRLTGSVPYGALVKLKDKRKRVVNEVVELVRLPMRKLFALPEGNTLGVVAWLD